MAKTIAGKIFKSKIEAAKAAIAKTKKEGAK